jgi:hypothetical protein
MRNATIGLGEIFNRISGMMTGEGFDYELEHEKELVR